MNILNISLHLSLRVISNPITKFRHVTALHQRTQFDCILFHFVLLNTFLFFLFCSILILFFSSLFLLISFISKIGSGFLTHHLALTNTFEASLRSIDPSVTLPYWDFTIEGEEILLKGERPSYMMEVTPIFSDTWFGSVDSFNHIADSRWEALIFSRKSCLIAFFHSSSIFLFFMLFVFPSLFHSFFHWFLTFSFLYNHQSHYCFVFSRLYPMAFLTASFLQPLHFQFPLQPRMTFLLTFSFHTTSPKSISQLLPFFLSYI